MFARIVTGLAPLMSEPARACEQADEALFGMRVEVLEEKKEWVRVRTHYRRATLTPRKSASSQSAAQT